MYHPYNVEIFRMVVKKKCYISCMIEDFKILGKYETTIFNNLDSFTSRFCRGDVFDLYAVYFSTESVSIHYILDGKSLGQHRSEERRVGKECRSRWSPYH